MNAWSDEAIPVVSFVCHTYNHRQFIGDTLDGFFGQVTQYPFEVIVRDDASTDGTVEVLREYANRYPRIIRLVLESENQFRKGVRPPQKTFPMALGKYIALCEGDDFWVDPLKIEKQVTLLEENTDVVVCYHDSAVVDASSQVLREAFLPKRFRRDYSRSELQRASKVMTQTMCFRNVLPVLPPEFVVGYGGDKFLCSLLGLHGRGVYLADVGSSCFRVHDGGLNRGVHDRDRKQRNYLRTVLAMYLYYDRVGREDLANHFMGEAVRRMKRLQPGLLRGMLPGLRRRLPE